MKKFGNMFLLAVCAGLSIAIGGCIYLTLENKIIGSLLFTVGLYTIVLNGLFLYTGKIGYFATTKEKKPYLILLLATWTGNLVGTGLGALMYIAVDGYKEKGNLTILFLCVSLFILCGFEHCIANMFYFSLAGAWSVKAVGYLLVMTLGNSVGGMLIPYVKSITAE